MKTMEMTKTMVTAYWDDSPFPKGERYRTSDWSSEDGDNWITGDGRPATGDEFETAEIHLRGGPRNCDVVS